MSKNDDDPPTYHSFPSRAGAGGLVLLISAEALGSPFLHRDAGLPPDDPHPEIKSAARAPERFEIAQTTTSAVPTASSSFGFGFSDGAGFTVVPASHFKITLPSA